MNDEEDNSEGQGQTEELQSQGQVLMYMPKKVVLTLQNFTTRTFEVGMNYVDEELKDHWWLKKHGVVPAADTLAGQAENTLIGTGADTQVLVANTEQLKPADDQQNGTGDAQQSAQNSGATKAQGGRLVLPVRPNNNRR